MRTIGGLFVVMMAAGAVAEACSCVSYPTLCERLATAKVAFVGTVIQGTEDETVAGPRKGFGSRPALMAVETVIRGLPEGVREITVNPMVGTSCYVPMKAGERNLILGAVLDGHPGVVITGGCSGGATIRPGDTLIPRMIASYLSGPNLFFGSVRLYKGWDSKYRTDNLVAGAEVKLAGAGREWGVKTDESGKFETNALPAGNYQFSVTKAGLSAEFESTRLGERGAPPGKITIPERGCVEASMLMHPDTRVAGRVRSVDGEVLSGIEVVAYEWDGTERRRRRSAVKTDSEGRFEVSRLTEGRYVFGVNAKQGGDGEYPTTYHPASPSLAGATPVTVGSDTRLDGIDILVPAKRKQVTVQVEVAWPDGKPVEMAMVRVEHQENGELFQMNRADGRSPFTNKEGIVALNVFEGTEYRLSAVWQKTESGKDGRMGKTIAWHRTDWVRVIGGVGAVVKLTLRAEPERNPF